MRPTRDMTMMEIAIALSRRATCAKLSVGCVLVNELGHIIGTGYNGVARGLLHCTSHPCAGAKAPKGSDLCEAVHAEQNALMQCQDVHDIHTMYVTHIPCMRCMKQLLNTSCSRIVYLTDAGAEQPAIRLWQSANRKLEILNGTA